jgi:hypothetical protein
VPIARGAELFQEHVTVALEQVGVLNEQDRALRVARGLLLPLPASREIAVKAVHANTTIIA